ncbi:hypothetical protein BOX15_Mlig021936g1 [Macrostomum lignano]|uniref:Uncharacterized protein n=1 Tax=Macrostomum lignano TaxID=282301 RepID=A0A267GYI3_9PLAT|nr:hypothetical protein BOX15_Mlig021936g1 [Macrostomum lignano]
MQEQQQQKHKITSTVLHIVVKGGERASRVHLSVCDNTETRPHELKQKTLETGEQIWNSKLHKTSDERLENIKVTEHGELKTADTKNILQFRLSATMEQEVLEYPIEFGEGTRFVPHFVKDEQVEFVIYCDDLTRRDFRVIPMAPICLIFEFQTELENFNTNFQLEIEYNSHKKFEKSRKLCSKCMQCDAAKQDHGDTQVWTLTIDDLLMANYNNFMRLPTGEPLRVLKAQAQEPSEFYDINLPVDYANPTQTYLIKLDHQAQPKVYAVAHIELHFEYEFRDVQFFEFRGNCSEFGLWKKPLKFEIKNEHKQPLWVAAAVVEDEGSKLFKTFDLKDFRFEVLLHFKKQQEAPWPKTCTISRLQVPLEPFSVFIIEICNRKKNSIVFLETMLSIEPVVNDVIYRLREIAGSRMSTKDLTILVPKLETNGEISKKVDADPQRTHDIWGDDLRMEERDDFEPEAKSGLTYLQLRQTRHQHESLGGRRIVLKRLNKQYHRYQDEAVGKLLDWNADEVRKAALNKICRGGASDSEYKSILQTLATEIHEGTCRVEDHSLLLQLAAAIVRGRAEALILSSRAQAWQKTNWDRHMVAAESWFQVVLALWKTRPNDTPPDFRKAIRRAGESPASKKAHERLATPFFYTWREN